MTGRAPGAKADLQSSPQVPRGGLSGRIGPRPRKTKTDHRSFGTIVEARGRFKVRYTGPDKQLHRAGMTFSTRERAQGWLAGELKLIEYGEWTPPAQRRIQAEAEAEAAVINFDDLNGDIVPSESLKTCLTEEFIGGRLLGLSKDITCSTRSLFLFYGNNVQPGARPQAARYRSYFCRAIEVCCHRCAYHR